MFIKQFRYSTDNLGYLIYSTSQGIAIDAGDVDTMLAFAGKNNIRITYVSNTHSHHDHTSGNQAILRKTNAEFIDCRQITSDKTIRLDNERIDVFHTPGHTTDSVTFKTDDSIISGDTLFNGTIGNCFSGDLNAFFKSLKRLVSLPKETYVYGGHDYVMESMAIAETIEKDNVFVDEYKKKYSPELIVSTLEDELNVNPYIRFNADGLIRNLKKKNMPIDTEFARFKSIMEIY